jgi:tetratricopeptide (TPR) repeat protein
MPHVRAPIAPGPSRTDVHPIQGADDVMEDTRSLEAPDADALVEHMLELVASEAATLVASAGNDGRLADLHVRIALATAGLRDDGQAAAPAILELAQGHPLAPRLTLTSALADGKPEALATVEARVVALPASEHATALAIEIVEAWLLRHGDAERAAALAERVLAGDVLDAWRPHLTELATLAHAVRGNWARVVELGRAALAADTAPEQLAALAALVLDRLGDPAAALAMCWAQIETSETPPTLGWLRVIDVALDAAWRAGDPRRLELLDRRADLVAQLPGSALDALANRHAVAAELTRDGQHAEALSLWKSLADETAAALPGGARRIATTAALWAAAAVGDRNSALATRRVLAASECPEVAAAHAWRALELAAADDAPGIAELAQAVADAADSPLAERWLDVLELPRPSFATLLRLEARGGLAVRWAAALAERLGDVPRAIQLWRQAAGNPTRGGTVPDSTYTAIRLGTEHDHVVRLLRAVHDEDGLAEVYAVWAAEQDDTRAASALWCGRGIVDLLRGDFVEAEESLQHAAELDPKDVFCRAALAAVYRAGKRHDQLAQMLAQLSVSLASADARAQAAREYAELLDEHLDDPAGARAALERMLDERPDDADALLSLAKLHDRERHWDRAIELRRRAVDFLESPQRRADIWIEVALGEERRGDREAAIGALDRAAEADPRRADVLREQARLHRAAGRFDRALEIVRAELATDPPIARRMQLQTEVAQLLTVLEREPEAVVAAYLDVLSIEPDQTDALAGIEQPARNLGLWDELARAFRGAPHTPRNLEVLAEALAKIAEWSELAEVRRRQLEAAPTPAEKAQHAAELAHLYEHELGDIDAAVRSLVLAQSHGHDEARHRDLVRLLREAKRWPELAAVLERELTRTTDRTRLVDLLLQLGELRADQLSRPADAVTAYEAAIERDPKNPVASQRLEVLYEQLGRDRELAHLLEARADATQDKVARAALLGRVGTLRANRGDIDGAIAAYVAAITADPSSREVFTQMERVCYRAERWAAAMQLYEIAIGHVEGGNSRAYRLGDLYLRRGNLQLGFLAQHEAAIESFQKVIEVDSQPAQAVKVLEELCRQRGDYRPLIEAWERRAEVQRDPARRTEALRLAAQLAAEHDGDPRASMRINRKLLSVDPGDLGAAATLERFFEETQDKSGLIDVLKLRLQHTHDQAETVGILRKIARASEEGARDVDTATEHYLKILELQPENRDALDALSRIYESTEQWAEFIDVTRRLIKVTSDRNQKALLYFKCGSVMEAKFGREQDAIRYYEYAIKASANCLPAVHGLRDLYRRREEWPRVIETLELEVKLWTDDKERAGVFAQIGRIYEKQLGDTERALHYYESALTVDPECLPANQALFEYHFDQGAWDKAGPLASALAQKAMRDGDPSTRSEFYRKRGVVARMTFDLKSAAESFIVALEIKPTNTQALDDFGSLAREQPDAWDFDATYRELEKVYKKRDDAGPLLARVHVGRAAYVERDGDLDQAATLYTTALELAPSDFTVLSALVEFHCAMRHWSDAIAAIEKFVASDAPPADRLQAMMRQAAIHADGEVDPARAVAVLRQVIDLEPAHQDAYYSLAQQYFLAAQHADARAAIDRVIELATAPGQPLIPEALARYYYYKGRILDASGDARAAAPQYRRAIEYDPGYAPPALVLARRAADAGDQRQAETLLIEAAHAAMAQGGPRAAVPLQRGLARILLASGDRPAAIEAYRGILNVEPDGASDRVALAEIYAVDDPTRAIGELRKVIDRDIHHAPAYRLLASFYSRTGDTERAHRVLTALDLLGFSEDADRMTMQRLRAVRTPMPVHHALDDDSRERLLITTAAQEPLGELWSALAEDITALVAPPSLGANLVPAESIGDARLLHIAGEITQLFGVTADIFVGDKVPGLAAVTAFPRRLLVVDRSLLDESDLALRFLFGYAFEAIRGGYASLLQLGARQRRELTQLLRGLLSPTGEFTGLAAQLVNGANTGQVRVIERNAGQRDVDPGAWIDDMIASAKRAGLLACDDFGAAIWTIARFSGEELHDRDETVALGAVLGGPDLVRFYLSDAYQALRDLLAAAA